MPAERAILAELNTRVLRVWVDWYELEVADRREKSQLIDALIECRRSASEGLRQTPLVAHTHVNLGETMSVNYLSPLPRRLRRTDS